MPERNDYKTGRPGGYNGNGNGGGNAFGNGGGGGGGGPLGAYVPPHSIEAEQSTLGAMLIERTAVEKSSRFWTKKTSTARTTRPFLTSSPSSPSATSRLTW